MLHRKTERGQALILIALAAIGLFAFAALAIDGSRAYSDKRHAQNTADTSVLAAALAAIRCDTGTATPCTDQQRFDAAKLAAEFRATSNGYTHDDVPINSGQENVKVYVNRCSDAGVTCDGIVAASSSEYIRVRIVSTIPATFGRVIGRPTITGAAEAIARVQTNSATSTGSFSSGAAMVGINDADSGFCLTMNGGAYLYTHDSGIYINCSSENAVFMNKNMEMHMDADGEIVGCWDNSSGNPNDPDTPHDPINCYANGGIPVEYDASDFAGVPTMPDPPTCDGTAYKSGNKIYPGPTGAGDAGNLVPIDSAVVFTAGTYCFDRDLNVNSGGSMSGQGDVVFVLENGKSWNLQNGENLIFDSIEIFANGNGVFRVGSGKMTADRLRFYSSGTGNFAVMAGGTVNSQDTYIYLKGGNIEWESGAKLNMHAAAQGDPEGVGGLLVYKPYGNKSKITFNGGSNVVLYGTFMVPTSPIILNGGTGFALHSQIIGWDYIVNGNATADIWYNAEENYNPPVAADPTIELTK